MRGSSICPSILPRFSFDLECPPFIEEAPAIMDVQATGAKSKGANRKDYHRGGLSPYAPVPVSPGAPQTQKIACFPAHDHHTSLLLNCHAESIVLQNRLRRRRVRLSRRWDTRVRLPRADASEEVIHVQVARVSGHLPVGRVLPAAD